MNYLDTMSEKSRRTVREVLDALKLHWQTDKEFLCLF